MVHAQAACPYKSFILNKRSTDLATSGFKALLLILCYLDLD